MKNLADKLVTKATLCGTLTIIYTQDARILLDENIKNSVYYSIHKEACK